jgi:hypothetical protein
MRLFFGQIPEAHFQLDEDEWSKLKEPAAWFAIWIIGVPTGILLFVTSSVVIVRWTYISTDGISLAGIVGVFIATNLGLGLIHLIFHPGFGLSSKSLLGLVMPHLSMICQYEGSMSRERFLIMIIAPFVILTVFLLLLSVVVPLSSWIIGSVILFSALAEGADLYGFFLILLRILPGAVIRNVGWSTYWRPNEESS